MSVDELRAGFSRLATHARPAAEPYARLIARRRKRFRLRLAGSATALLAAAVSAPLALQAGTTAPAPPPPGLNPWVQRLIDSPTRGSLATDAAFITQMERVSDAERDQFLVPDELDRTKVLLADDVLGHRHVIVVHYSQTHAQLTHRWAQGPAGVDELMNGSASHHETVDPFFLHGMRVDETNFVALGLAPTGCVINTSEEDSLAGLRGYVARAAAMTEVWRVSCDGREMESRRVVGGTTMIFKPNPADAYGDITGREGLVRWDRNGTIVVGPKSGAGPAFLIIGDSDNGVVALEPPTGTPTPTRTVDGQASVLIGTGNAYANGDIVVIRVPQRAGGGAALSGQVLVLGPVGSRAEAIADSGLALASTTLADGLGYLTFEVGAAARIRVGSTDFDFDEPATGQRIFEQPLFSHWG